VRTAAVVFLLALSAAAAPPRPRVESAPAAPDLLFFEQKVAADLHIRCASCHSDPEMAGRFLLKPLGDVARPDRAVLLANFRASLRFVDPRDPAASSLLRKSLGGDRHGGGALFRSMASPDYRRLLEFAMGATLDNRPPEAILTKRLELEVGQEVALDGSLSGDPDGNAITYRWTVAERPPGSQARLVPGAGGDVAILGPDRPGVYRVELAVHDGRLASLPASTIVVATAKPTPAPAAAEARGSGEPAFLDRALDRDRLRLVRRLFLDLKWRTPSLEEIETCYGRTHEENVDAFLADEETWEAWYEQQLYYFLLLDTFRPKEGRLTELPRDLARGELAVVPAIREIISSQYFNARNPGNDTYVTVVLEQCLGVVVQEREGKRLLDAGKKMYDGYRTTLFKEKGNSQNDFVRLVCEQPDFFRHLLRRTWRELHGSEIPADRLESDADRFRREAGSFRDILRSWLTGPAYVQGAREARTKPEIPYVRGLFVDTLGRTPTYEELRNVRNAFLSLADPTPIRLVMGRVLLQSDQARPPASVFDPTRFVKEQFVRLFARPATNEELRAFVKALRDDAQVTPQVVLWTLLSSPEYQTY